MSSKSKATKVESMIKLNFERGYFHMNSNGQYPSMCINKRGWIIQAYHKETVVNYRLRYKIGFLGEDKKIVWAGRFEVFNVGYYPRIAMNDDGLIIVVFSAQIGRQIFYRLGRLKFNEETTSLSTTSMVNSATIHWLGNKEVLGSGRSPDVSINNKNTVVIAYDRGNVRIHTCYRVGDIKATKVVWRGKEDERSERRDKRLIERGLSKTTSIALNDKNQVVVGYSSVVEKSVHFLAGKISNNENILLDREGVYTPNGGISYEPVVTLNNLGQVAAVYHGWLSMKINHGVLVDSESGSSVSWELDTAMRFAYNGYYASVALSDSGRFVTCYKSMGMQLRKSIRNNVGELSQSNTGQLSLPSSTTPPSPSARTPSPAPPPPLVHSSSQIQPASPIASSLTNLAPAVSMATPPASHTRLQSCPGITFSNTSIKAHIKPSHRTELKAPDMGIALTIPEDTLDPTEDNIDLLIRPCLHGPFELPSGYRPASPAYLVETSRSGVELRSDVTLRVEHFVRLKSREDCEKMAFLTANPKPLTRHSAGGRPVYAFREEEREKWRGVFEPESHVGTLVVRHFCLIILAIKDVLCDNLYSARLYRGDRDSAHGASAVFCMCIDHPLFRKLCDEKISEEYMSMLPRGEGRSITNFVRLVASEVTLNTSNSDVTFDRGPPKIKREELNAPLVLPTVNLEDYPPRFYIFANSALYATRQQDPDSSPQLLVHGLSDECSFKIFPGTLPNIPPGPSSNERTVIAVIEKQVSEPSYDEELYKQIIKEIEPIKKEWDLLGIQLGLQKYEMEEIEANEPRNVQRYKEKMIARWLGKSGEESPWRKLVEALRSDMVSHNALAHNIELKYCANTL